MNGYNCIKYFMSMIKIVQFIITCKLKYDTNVNYFLLLYNFCDNKCKHFELTIFCDTVYIVIKYL